ncbi:MAG: hypothetical protein FWD68_15330 [Alphaproteobacteria bacterium]|nr:hypothetical protein [Alphaproteobacteria bacterium]
MRILPAIAASLIAATAHAAPPCTTSTAAVSPTVRALASSRFANITSLMPVWAILDELGPASRDIGSGGFVLVWDVTDGRQFSVAAASLCATPYRVGFINPRPHLPTPNNSRRR